MNSETSNARRARILVVDDTTANLLLLTNLLTEHGYSVFPASDGELALEFVRSTLPDLILLDIRMPEMDGYEVCRRLKADGRTCAVPVIFISILEDERDKMKGFQAGGVDYITKPFQQEEVLARVGTHLRLRELAGNLEQKVAERTGQLAIANERLQREIAERKQAEEEIRRLKNYLSNIINSMPSVLVGMDRDETVTQWNREAEKISGISATEAVGRPITELLPDFSPWIEAMRSEIELQRSASMEKLLIEKDGERRFYDLMLYPLIGDGVEGAVLRIEDATERARIQELMILTEKMMSVGGLAAGMAHEINNPLGIITQAAQNVERRVSPRLPANRKAAEDLGIDLEAINAYFEKRQIPEFIGSIREASLRASRIIANMLQFSRCAGTAMQPVSPIDIIEQALELAVGDYDLKKKFDFRSIEIIRDFAPDMPEVPMVVVEMEQVILNLLKNAAQAMSVNPPDHWPKITLRLRREERYALIEVEDNGPGMEEDVRRRAFEPFFTTKEPGIGTGLGLSVSYMIVTQNHKGLMEVDSSPGKGACFRVRLPLSNPG